MLIAAQAVVLAGGRQAGVLVAAVALAGGRQAEVLVAARAVAPRERELLLGASVGSGLGVGEWAVGQAEVLVTAVALA